MRGSNINRRTRATSLSGNAVAPSTPEEILAQCQLAMEAPLMELWASELDEMIDSLMKITKDSSLQDIRLQLNSGTHLLALDGATEYEIGSLAAGPVSVLALIAMSERAGAATGRAGATGGLDYGTIGKMRRCVANDLERRQQAAGNEMFSPLIAALRNRKQLVGPLLAVRPDSATAPALPLATTSAAGLTAAMMPYQFKHSRFKAETEAATAVALRAHEAGDIAGARHALVWHDEVCFKENVGTGSYATWENHNTADCSDARVESLCRLLRAERAAATAQQAHGQRVESGLERSGSDFSIQMQALAIGAPRTAFSANEKRLAAHLTDEALEETIQRWRKVAMLPSLGKASPSPADALLEMGQLLRHPEDLTYLSRERSEILTWMQSTNPEDPILTFTKPTRGSAEEIVRILRTRFGADVPLVYVRAGEREAIRVLIESHGRRVAMQLTPPKGQRFDPSQIKEDLPAIEAMTLSGRDPHASLIDPASHLEGATSRLWYMTAASANPTVVQRALFDGVDPKRCVHPESSWSLNGPGSKTDHAIQRCSLCGATRTVRRHQLPADHPLRPDAADQGYLDRQRVWDALEDCDEADTLEQLARRDGPLDPFSWNAEEAMPVQIASNKRRLRA